MPCPDGGTTAALTDVQADRKTRSRRGLLGLRRTTLSFATSFRFGATASYPPMCIGAAIGDPVLTHRVDALTRHPGTGAAQQPGGCWR